MSCFRSFLWLTFGLNLTKTIAIISVVDIIITIQITAIITAMTVVLYPDEPLVEVEIVGSSEVLWDGISHSSSSADIIDTVQNGCRLRNCALTLSIAPEVTHCSMYDISSNAATLVVPWILAR